MNLLSIIYDYRVILFYSILIIILFISRKKFEIHGKIMGMYKTKIGIKLMDKISGKYREFVKIIGYSCIGLGFAGLIFIFFMMLKVNYDLIMSKITAGASPVLPGVPIVGTGLVFPLVIGWITIFIVMVVHEFSHGVVARAFKMKIKSTGILFLGPILGAFVEPDEKEIQKRPDIEQYSMFAAGPISNILFAFIGVLILGFVIAPIFSAVSMENGVVLGLTDGYPAIGSGMPENSVVTALNGRQLYDINSFKNISKDIVPNQTVTLTTTKGEYSFITVTDPNNASKGYMGVLLLRTNIDSKPGFYIIYVIFDWLVELFVWLNLISFSIGIINLHPMFITDGARLLKTAIERIVPDRKKAFAIWKNINIIGLLLLLNAVLFPLIKWLIKISVRFVM